MKIISVFLIIALIGQVFSTTEQDFINLIGSTVNFSCSDINNTYITEICDLALFGNSTGFMATVESAKSLDFLLNTSFPFLNGSEFVQDYLPAQIQGLADKIGLDQLYIVEPHVYINTGNNKAAVFSGKSPSDVFVEVGVMKTQPVSVLFMVSTPFSSLDALLSNFIPNVHFDSFFDIFSNSSNFSLVATNGFDFTPIPELKPASIPELNTLDDLFFGVTANLKISDANNNVCNFLRSHLGPDVELSLMLSVVTTAFSGFIGFPNLVISNNLTLSNFGATISVQLTNPVPEISFGGQMELFIFNTTLNLSGYLIFSAIDVQLVFSTNNLWIGAFGLSRLSFGNLNLGGGITYTGTPEAFSIGAEISYGEDCYNGREFVGDGYCLFFIGNIGIDLENPANNHFNGHVSNLTLDTILRAVIGSKTQQNVIVPPILSNAISFAQGLNISYGWNAIKTQNGYFFEGGIQVFNVSASANIQVNTVSNTFSGYMEASPINFGNVFTLLGASSNGGPFINISASLFPPTLGFQMSAIVTVLGITKTVNINFDLSRMFFPITGALQNGILTTNLLVQLNYVQFTSFNFNVTGSIQNDQNLLSLIQNITANITQILQNAESQLTQAQAKVFNAQANITALSSSICANIQSKCKKSSCSNIFCTFVNWVIDNSCVLACNASQIALNVATDALIVAQKSLNITQKSIGGFANAANYIANNVVTVFNIVDAGFNLMMNASNVGSFNAGIQVNVDIIVLGTTYKRNMVWNFSNSNAIAQTILLDVLGLINSKFS